MPAPAHPGARGLQLQRRHALNVGGRILPVYNLRRRLRGDEFWAQGYSEPNAGSDLASIRTRARLEDSPRGPEWVIDGQKIWTSLAQHAQWIFVLCRTEEGSQGSKGLSFLLVPLDQPGITLRPIRQITGDAEFNETFFADCGRKYRRQAWRRLESGDVAALTRAGCLIAGDADELPQ